MHKYWARIVKGFQISLAYRAEFFIWVVLDSLPIVVMLFVWSAIFRAGGELNSYRVGDIILYYLLVTTVERIITAHFSHWRVEEIRRGRIDFFLLRPFGYLTEIITAHIGGKLMGYIFYIPILALAFGVAYHLVDLPTLQITPAVLAAVVLLLFFGFIFEIMLSLVVVLIGFWLEEAAGLEHFKWISVSLFSGSIMPLVFLPTWLQNAAAVLPFRFLFSVPVEIILGRYWLVTSDLLSMAITLVIGGSGIWLLWRGAMRQYTSVGG